MVRDAVAELLLEKEVISHEDMTVGLLNSCFGRLEPGG